jgi:uncharacterized protein
VTDTIIEVRVIPRAAKDEIAGWTDGVLRVRVKAPPVDGKANQALLDLLARRLGLSSSRIEIVGGATARTKRIRLVDVTRDEVLKVLA